MCMWTNSDHPSGGRNISRTLIGNEIVDHSDVVGASPVGAASTTSSFAIYTWLQYIAQIQLQEQTRNI